MSQASTTWLGVAQLRRDLAQDRQPGLVAGMVVALRRPLVRSGVGPLQQRRVRQQGQALRGGVVDQLLGDEVELPGIGLRQQVAVLLLDAVVGGAAGGTRDRAGPRDPPGGVVAGAQQADRAALGQLRERLHSLLQGRGAVLDVGVVEVQPLHTELAQAGLGLLPDRLGAKALPARRAGVAGDQRPRAHLGRHHDLVGHAPGPAPAADDPLALAGVAVPLAVVVGRVEEVAARLQEAVEDGERGALVGPVAEVHRAQTELADPEADPAVADGSLVHGGAPFSNGAGW
jgi:hypothetical protein